METPSYVLGGVKAAQLPGSGLWVEYARITQDSVLKLGYMTLMFGGRIDNLPPPEQEKKIKQNLEMARKVMCDRVFSPLIVPGKPRGEDEVSVLSIPDEDVIWWYMDELHWSGLLKKDQDEQKVRSAGITDCKYIWGKLCHYWGWDPILDKERDPADVQEALDIMNIILQRDSKNPPKINNPRGRRGR